jgi:cobalamin-dependent methionine synthase I
MLVIGENINATRKSVAEAIISRNAEFLAGMAKSQAEAGADFIDVNVGTGQLTQAQQVEAMKWLIEVVQGVTDKPLTIDSDVAEVIKAALGKYQGERLIINSVTAERERLESIGPLAVERKAWLVALAMGAEGIPETAEERLANCETIMNYLTGIGMAPEQVLFDPLVLPISVDSTQGKVTLDTLKQIKERFPTAKSTMGLSNISFGLPNRSLINRAFMVMSAYVGLDTVIINPLDAKAMSMIRVADILTGADYMCRNFTRAYRRGMIVD